MSKSKRRRRRRRRRKPFFIHYSRPAIIVDCMYCRLHIKVKFVLYLGLSIMFLSLEQAGKNLYKTVSHVTVQTLQHK